MSVLIVSFGAVGEIDLILMELDSSEVKLGEFVFIAYDQKDVKLSYLSQMRTKTRTTASTGAQIFNSINKKT